MPEAEKRVVPYQDTSPNNLLVAKKTSGLLKFSGSSDDVVGIMKYLATKLIPFASAFGLALSIAVVEVLGS